MSAHAAYHSQCLDTPDCAVDRRALSRWPGLDRHALARCRHDPERIARLVARRSSLMPRTIRVLLEVPTVAPDDGTIWFG